MSKEVKIIVTAAAATVVLVIGAAFIFGGKSKGENLSEEENSQVLNLNIEANPGNYDLGNVKIDGGKVYKDYEIKNTTGGSIKLKRIATSCMCTEAKISVNDKETIYFGMEMHGDKNPPVNLEIATGATAKVTTSFDPAAHGPEGVGPFDRIVWLYFDKGTKELLFKGTVVK